MESLEVQISSKKTVMEQASVRYMENPEFADTVRDATQEVVHPIVSEEIAKVVADAPESFDTLKEIADWIEGHEDDAAAMNSAIQQNSRDISQNTSDIAQNTSDIEELSKKGIEVKKKTQAEYDALPEAEKNSGLYVITDANTMKASNMPYDGSVTGLGSNVQQAIDTQFDNLTSKTTWELIGTVTGGNTVSIDNSKYQEYLVIARYSSLVICTIVYSVLTQTPCHIPYGVNNSSASNCMWGDVVCYPTYLSNNQVFQGGSNVTASSTFTVYGR